MSHFEWILKSIFKSLIGLELLFPVVVYAQLELPVSSYPALFFGNYPGKHATPDLSPFRALYQDKNISLRYANQQTSCIAVFSDEKFQQLKSPGVPSFSSPKRERSLDDSPKLAIMEKQKINTRIFGKIVTPLAVLGALAATCFRHTRSIDSAGGGYLQYYESLLVLSSMTHLGDGFTELLKSMNLGTLDASGVAALVMLVPLEWAALVREDIIFNKKALTLSQAVNHFGFKATANQVDQYISNHYLTELTANYVQGMIFADTPPTVQRMMKKSISVSVIATPWLLSVVIDTYRYDKNRKIYLPFDSFKDFLFSTSMSTTRSLVQMGIHEYLDGHKHSNNHLAKVDENEIISELLTGGIFASLWFTGVSANQYIQWLPATRVNAIASTIIQEISKHSLKTSMYSVSNAINNDIRSNYGDSLTSDLISAISLCGISYLVASLSPVPAGMDYLGAVAFSSIKTGFTIPCIKTQFKLGLRGVAYIAEPTNKGIIYLAQSVYDRIPFFQSINGFHQIEDNLVNPQVDYDDMLRLPPNTTDHDSDTNMFSEPNVKPDEADEDQGISFHNEL